MRTFLLHLAVVVPLVLIVVLVAVPAQGQFKVNTFDRAVADSDFAVVYNGSAFGTAPNPYHTISDDATTKREGSAALKNAWRVHTTESWGGLNMLSMTLPTKNNNGYFARNYRAKYGDSTYISWGAGTHLSLWYNNLQPSNGAANVVQMRLHIYEGGPGSNYYIGDTTNVEDWYFQSPLPLNDAVAGWHELIIPLVDTGTRNSPGDQGFCITDWSYAHQNDKLDLDNIIGYTIEWTAGKAVGDTASGIVFYDDLRLQGLGQKPGYASVYSFSNYTKDTTDFAGGWNNGGLSKFNFFREQTDTLMGSSVLGVDWAINVKETWGGGANREYNAPAATYFADLSGKKELQLYAKVVSPLVSTHGAIQNKITLRFVLFDYSDGQKEEWYTVAPVRLDSIGVAIGWQQIRLPLDWIQSGNWGDLKAGRFNTPNGSKDQVLGLDKVGGMKLEFSCSADAGEPNNDPSLVYSGQILFSNVVPSGFRQTDKTAPAAVTSVQATTSQPFQNIITWADVPNERGSTYSVWVSEHSFTKTTDPGVSNIATQSGLSLALGTQLASHSLLYPKVDHSVALYYGVTATDSVGNVNDPAVIGPVTNTAKGVPTISWGTVNNFVADGNLSEWASITPIVLSAYANPPTAFIVTNTTIASDADCSAKAYLAADQNYFYAAFDVTDNLIQIDTTSPSSWLQDSPDLFLGLYDWRSAHHGSYSRGAAPDYHLRFSLNKAISDNPGGTLLTPGANYIFKVNQVVSGYQVEARIPWSAFKGITGNDTLFVPQEGMRIPIDFEINDNDAGGSVRKGQLDYSQFANGNSYADAWRWTYTWLGAKPSVVGVEEQPTVANVYALLQNYPNPFNPSTVIRYSLAKSGPVSVKVFDILGREVATLVNGEVQSAGEHQVRFATSSLRGGASSGVYFYQIISGAFRDVKKMMLVK